MWIHQYWLRPGLMIRLSLPDDLTSQEAERLAQAVQTFPIPPVVTPPKVKPARRFARLHASYRTL